MHKNIDWIKDNKDIIKQKTKCTDDNYKLDRIIYFTIKNEKLYDKEWFK